MGGTAQEVRNEPGSVGELLAFLLTPRKLAWDDCPPWPPDLFAVTASVLQQTGGYIRVSEAEGEFLSQGLDDEWVLCVRRLARSWRTAIDEALARDRGTGEPLDALDRIPVPDVIRGWWRELVALAASVSLLDLMRDTSTNGPEVCRLLLRLCLVADEASPGAGWPRDPAPGLPPATGRAPLSFEGVVDRLLSKRMRLESMCWWVRTEKACVLPKAHTPQRGLSLRSLTHHLALCSPSEVVASWHSPVPRQRRPDVVNLLLLPWPFATETREFEAQAVATLDWRNRNRFFRFGRAKSHPERLREYVERAIEEAERHVNGIDVLVFPELSLCWDELQEVEKLALTKGTLLIGGADLREGEWEPEFRTGGNVCVVQSAGLLHSELGRLGAEAAGAFSEEAWKQAAARIADQHRVGQRKHHRWCLDGNQILQYQLGGVLPASKDCWERIPLDRRRLNFVTLGRWLTLSVLICEDLAQQDPMADVLRSVGPNLVVALLMDGPQVRGRWASRYASVLTDDPGCSVLTMTSLGMAARSRPLPGHEDRRRVFALWRDIRTGEEELEMPEGCDAAVLSVACRTVEEYSADGRSDGRSAHIPTFAGMWGLGTGVADSLEGAFVPLEPGPRASAGD